MECFPGLTLIGENDLAFVEHFQVSAGTAVPG